MVAGSEEGSSEVLVGLAADAVEFTKFGGKTGPLSFFRFFLRFFGGEPGCDLCSGSFTDAARADVPFDRFAAFVDVTVVVPIAVDPFPRHVIIVPLCVCTASRLILTVDLTPADCRQAGPHP
jgi:hypothetical protein